MPWLAETLKGLRSPEGLARIDPGAALNGTLRPYGVVNLPGGACLMVIAGLMSGLLGIGAGAVKVTAMDFGIPHALPFYLLLGLLCGFAAVLRADFTLQYGVDGCRYG